jgi:MFS family permease
MNLASPLTFNRLAWSNLAAQSAEQVALAAAPIVAVLLLGVGEGQTGLLQTALTLPFILFAIPAGLLADRISRRWLMAGAEALRAAALLGILVLIWFGWLTLPLLALLGFVAVCGTVVYSVAAPALVPSLVSPRLLPAANARIELARTIAFASGPALGGVLVGWVGAAPAFGFAAALSVIAVVLLSGIYEPSARARAAPSSAAGHQGRRGVRVASSAVAAGVHHPVHLQHRLVPGARGVRALCGAPSRTVGDRRRRHAGDVRRRHGGRRALGNAADAPIAVRHRDRPRTGDRLVAAAVHGADHRSFRRRCLRASASSCSASGRSCG